MDPTWAKRGALVAVGRTAPSSNGAGGSQPAGRAGDGVIQRDELESLPVVKLRWNAALEDLGDGLLCTDINISEISPAGGGVLGACPLIRVSSRINTTYTYCEQIITTDVVE